MNEETLDKNSTAANLLKGAALGFGLLGGGFFVWVIDKWFTYPDMRASQFGFEAPLWPALATFVLLATVAVSALFWQAARRVERGENLFAQRHRRRKSDRPDPKNGQVNP